MSILPTTTRAALLLAACSAIALAAPPAPQITAHANAVKQLRFNWNPVTGASGYELWFQSNPSAAQTRFSQVPGSRTSVLSNVSVHLLDWNNARYWLNACDSSGCSSSSKIAVGNVMLDTIGQYSSPSQQAASQFGYAVAISADASTLAIAAPFESTDDPHLPKGSAYIYRKAASGWAFQSAIPFDVVRDGRTQNVRLSLDRAGDVLAIALMGDQPHGASTGIGYGAVKIFRFVANNGWRHDATIAMLTGFEFGSADWAELDDSGNTLAVKTALGGSGVFIYTYDSAGTWSHTGTAFGHGADADLGKRCGHFAFSADGKVLAYACGSYAQDDTVLEVHAAPGWGLRDNIPVAAGTFFVAPQALDATGDALAVTFSSDASSDLHTDIYRRVNGSYQREAVLRAGAWESGSGNIQDRFGAEARFSADGKLLVVADPSDHGVGVGALPPPLTAGSKAIGAVYVYERRPSGWALRRVVKPGRPGAMYEAGQFGRALAFGDNGKTLAVGHPTANNNAGVVWLY
ncbi:MAG TPA: hypothetical protein VK624_19920 [Steroidobacteraceae bacterium]|nr:hypothetical protein [Steroidobacteraceae bacterium]